jgi:hypothetical protein
MASNTSVDEERRSVASKFLATAPVMAARNAIRARRQSSGTTAVTQEDADLAADVIVRSGKIRPYPQLIAAITGGSLTTVAPLFDDWWHRFVLRGVDPNSPSLEISAKVGLHAKLLVGQFEAALRELVRGAPDPQQALIAAARIGQQQALQSQVTALKAQRDDREKLLAALTYKVSELETRLQEHATKDAANAEQLREAADRLERALLEANARANEARRGEPALQDILEEVRQLTASVNRRRRIPRSNGAPVRRKSKRKRSEERTLRATRQSARLRKNSRPQKSMQKQRSNRLKPGWIA